MAQTQVLLELEWSADVIDDDGVETWIALSPHAHTHIIFSGMNTNRWLW